jgi:hypothetical protein
MLAVPKVGLLALPPLSEIGGESGSELQQVCLGQRRVGVAMAVGRAGCVSSAGLLASHTASVNEDVH